MIEKLARQWRAESMPMYRIMPANRGGLPIQAVPCITFMLSLLCFTMNSNKYLLSLQMVFASLRLVCDSSIEGNRCRSE